MEEALEKEESPEEEVIEQQEVSQVEDEEVEIIAAAVRAPFKAVNPMVVSKRWKEYFDEASQRHYYYDRVTKGVQWRKPAGFLTRQELLRPVSANQIGQSDWKVVATLSGRDFFFNAKTNVAVWNLPEDFNTPIPTSTTAPADEEASANQKKRTRDEELDELDVKGAPVAKKPKLSEKPSKHINVVDAFVSAQDSGVTHFKLMLEHYGVDKDAKWSDWQPKLAKDGRFNAIASLAEKRSVFETHVRQLASSYKQEKKERLKAAKEALWTEIEKIKFSTSIGFDAFKDLLRPTNAYLNLRDLDPDSIGDLYDEAMTAATEKQKKEKNRAKRDFLAMLDEKIKDRYARDTRKDWLDFKLELEEDPRYNRAHLSGIEREELFEDFARDVRHSLSSKGRSDKHDRDGHEERRQDDKRQHRETVDARQEALRLREREVANKKAWEEKTIRSKHERMREEQEKENFRTLLAERVLRTNVSWEDMEPSLSRDPRFDTQYFNTRDKIALFKEFQEQMQQQSERKFRRFLDTHGSGDFYQTWNEASDSLFDTPAFSMLPTNEARAQAFAHWANDRRVQAEADLVALFKETPTITAETDLDNKKESIPLIDELKKDARWRTLPESHEFWNVRRLELLGEFIASLSQK